MDRDPAVPKSFDPVVTEITVMRLLDELQGRRSRVSANRRRVEQLSTEIAKLRERLYAEKQRATDAEGRAAQARIGIRLKSGSQLRPLLARDSDLGNRRAELEQGLAALEEHVCKLENQRMELQSKVRDLRDHAEHLASLESTHASLLHELQVAGRAALSDFHRVSEAQHEVEGEAIDTLEKQAALDRENDAHVARLQRLLSENSLLKESLDTAQHQLRCSEALGDSREVREPRVNICNVYADLARKFKKDLESCRRDLDELKRALHLTDVNDIGVQTTSVQRI